MVCKLELFCKYNYILHCFLTYWWIFTFVCFFWVYTRLATLTIVYRVPCTNCYKKKVQVMDTMSLAVMFLWTHAFWCWSWP